MQEVVSVNAVSGTADHGDAAAGQELRAGEFRLQRQRRRGQPTAKRSRNSSAAAMPAKSFRRFTLRQPPLTYVSASQRRAGGIDARSAGQRSASGRKRRRFTGARQRPRLHQRGATMTARPTVQFGDGMTGARLPSGQNNIRAKYRKGIGVEGLVKAGQLSMLLSRPLGVKGVTNPLAAERRARPRTNRRRARQRAAARAHPGTGRVAAATTKTLRAPSAASPKLWRAGSGTVASRGCLGDGGGAGRQRAILPRQRDLRQSAQSDARRRRSVRRPARQDLSSGLFPLRRQGQDRCLPIEIGAVLAAVEQALRDGNFLSLRRDFGQPVTLSEVIAAMQAVAGVIAVDVDKLYRSGTTREFAAAPARRSCR